MLWWFYNFSHVSFVDEAIAFRLRSSWLACIARYCDHDTIAIYYQRRCIFMYIILNSYWNTINISRNVFTTSRLFSSTHFLFSRAEHDPMTILDDNVVDYAKKTHTQTDETKQQLYNNHNRYALLLCNSRQCSEDIIKCFEGISSEICLGRHSKFIGSKNQKDNIR